MIKKNKRVKIFCAIVAIGFIALSIIYVGCTNSNLKDARKYLDKGNLEKAKYYYEKYFESNSNNKSAIAEYELLKGNYKKAKELFIEAKISDYSSKMGRCALLLNDFENSLKFYSEAIKSGSENSNDYLEVGFIYFKTGKYEKAKEYFKKALLLDPESPNAYLGLGKTCFARLEYDEAISAYKSAIKYKKDFVEAYVGVGDVYEFLDQYNSADESYKNALKYNQKFAKAYLGLSTLKLKQQKWDESVKYFKKYEELKDK